MLTLRRAHKVHRITCIQMECSLWCRGIEKGLIGTCTELGIDVVAYSPLGRGSVFELRKSDFRSTQERLTGENLKKNLEALERVEKLAEEKHASTSQLALAWLLHRQSRTKGAGVVPIPGTTKEKHLISNVQATEIALSNAEISALEEAVKADETLGERYPVFRAVGEQPQSRTPTRGGIEVLCLMLTHPVSRYHTSSLFITCIQAYKARILSISSGT